MLRATRRREILLEASLKEASLIGARNIRAGELPDELGEVLSADCPQQSVGKIVELDSRIVEVKRSDPPLGKQTAMQPLQETRLSGSILSDDHDGLDPVSGLMLIKEPVHSRFKLVRKDEAASNWRSRPGGLERVEFKLELLRHAGHGGVLYPWCCR